MANTQIKGNQILDKTIRSVDVDFSDAIDSNSIVSGDSFLMANGQNLKHVGSAQFIESIKAGFNVTLGGALTVSSSGYVKWSNRYIVSSNGNSSDFATLGYYYIETPISGTITGVGGASNVTATSDGIPLSDYQALYYILPTSSGSTSLPGNFRVASYSSSLIVPQDWLLLCVVNGNNHVFYFPNGIKLSKGQTINPAINDAVNADMIDGYHIDRITGLTAGLFVKTTGDTMSGSLNINGNLNVVGNITITGSTYETHANKIFTSGDTIILRDGAISGLASGSYVGLIAKKYDGTNDGGLIFDNAGVARVGDIDMYHWTGTTQAIATREDSPINGGFAYWDNSTLKFNTRSMSITVTGTSGVSGGGTITNGTGTITLTHTDVSTSSGITADNSNGVVLQDLTIGVGPLGHVTGTSIGTVDLDTRYGQTGTTITVVAGTGLAGGGTINLKGGSITIGHVDVAGSGGNLNVVGSGGQNVQGITLGVGPLGHVTGSSATLVNFDTRYITTGKTATVTSGAGLTGGGSFYDGNGSITVSHADTSSASNISSDNSNGVVIQDINFGLDTYGHVTSASVGTVDLDTRYFTETESIGKFLQVTGGTINGNLKINNDLTVSGDIILTDVSNYINSNGPLTINRNDSTGHTLSYITLDDNEIFMYHKSQIGIYAPIVELEGQLKSTLATGTAPLVVASTTVVPNLNVDMLDGLHSSSFVQTGTTVTINGTSQNLSANRTWNVGTITGITVSAGDGLTGGGTISSTTGPTSGTITVSHADTSSASNISSDNSNGVVIQDINFGLDTYGHVTSASVGTVDLDTRYLTTSKTITVTAGDGLTGGGVVNLNGGTITVSHADTSSAGNILSDNSNGVVIQDINFGLDTYGHVTGTSVGTVDLDTRYFTEAESISKFLQITGGTINGYIFVTGQADINGVLTTNNFYSFSAASFLGDVTFVGPVTANTMSVTSLGAKTINTTSLSATTVNATGQIISKVTTGTPPLVVASTTVVPNLNVDMLDGLHSSSFVQTTGGTITGNLQISGNTSVRGTGTFVGGGFNSKRELKNIHDDWSGSAINEISNFKIRDFNYKNQPNINRTLGLIIDEIPDTISDYLIMGENHDSINLYSMHALSFKAHQEEINEINELKNEIKELKNIINNKYGLEWIN